MSRSVDVQRIAQSAIIPSQHVSSNSNSLLESVSNALQDQGPVVNKCLIANDEQMSLLALTLQFE